jgi:hypothetical protein
VATVSKPQDESPCEPQESLVVRALRIHGALLAGPMCKADDRGGR